VVTVEFLVDQETASVGMHGWLLCWNEMQWIVFSSLDELLVMAIWKGNRNAINPKYTAKSFAFRNYW